MDYYQDLMTVLLWASFAFLAGSTLGFWAAYRKYVRRRDSRGRFLPGSQILVDQYRDR